MTPLQQKLNQLNLTSMSHHLDRRSLTPRPGISVLPQTLECSPTWNWNPVTAVHRAPFPFSRLQAQHSIDAFTSSITRAARELKTRILRLLDLEFIANGTSVILIGNPGVGKTFLAKIIGWRACQANQRVLFTTAMDMLNHLLASQVDHSLIRKLKTYTEPTLLIV